MCEWLKSPLLLPPRPKTAGLAPSPSTSPSTSPTPASVFAISQLNFTPDPTQSALLDSPARNLILCCTRQWGKSTVCAIKALHFALHHPGSTTLIAAPGLRQSAEFLAKAAAFLNILGIPRRTDRRNSRSLFLPNGARLVAVPANHTTTRGFSPHLLLIDEAAFVPASLIHALLPSLAATAGALWLLSTPNGQSGFFYETWHSDSEWARFQVPATACPRIAPDFLAHQRLLLGEHVFASEYLCEFTPGPGQLFPRELFDSALDDSILPLELRP
jgi:hypothetical protein